MLEKDSQEYEGFQYHEDILCYHGSMDWFLIGLRWFKEAFIGYLWFPYRFSQSIH